MKKLGLEFSEMSAIKRKILGYEAQTVADTAAAPTWPDAATCDYAYGTLETAQIRFRVDGTDPTSSEGHLLEVGQALELNQRDEIENFKAIRTGATSGVVRWTFYERLGA